MRARSTIAAALAVLLLTFPLGGCKKKDQDGPATKGGDGSGNPVHERRKDGPSQSILGKVRDRVLDVRDMHAANQIKQSLQFDIEQGAPGPPNDFEWSKVLAAHKELRGMLTKGELQVYYSVKLGAPNVVLLYEKSIETEDAARYVLTADGTLHVMKKAQLDALQKPSR
jgi:hypothetical protein